jgi:hypothetical protein
MYVRSKAGEDGLVSISGDNFPGNAVGLDDPVLFLKWVKIAFPDFDTNLVPVVDYNQKPCFGIQEFSIDIGDQVIAAFAAIMYSRHRCLRGFIGIFAQNNVFQM